MLSVMILAIFVYAFSQGQILLRIIVALLLVVVYLLARQKKYAHLSSAIIGMIAAVYGYFVITKPVLSLILGTTVYVALVLYRRTD